MVNLPLVSMPRSTHARRRAKLCTIALAVAAAFTATPAVALSLGNADVTSFLGQPLQMRVPVVLDDPSDAGQPACD